MYWSKAAIVPLIFAAVRQCELTLASGNSAAPGCIYECALLIHSAFRVSVLRFSILANWDVYPLSYDGGNFAIVLRIASIPFVEGDFTVGAYLVTNSFRRKLT